MTGTRRSVQRQVALSLSVAIAVAAAIAAIVAYGIAFLETNELQDAQLTQIAQLVAVQPAFPPSGRFTPKDSEDAEVHLVVKRLGLRDAIANPSTDLPLPASLPAGLQTIEHAGVEWRVLVSTAADGETFGVAQRMTVRDEMAQGSAALTLLPLVLFVPLLLLVLRSVLRRAFRPLVDLSNTVDGLGEKSLVPLATDDVPVEALGLVQATNRLLDRLGTAIAQQRRLISDAAHELRTPVTALMLQAENLAKAELPPLALERLSPLRQGLARMASLLEQLLGLARLQGTPDSATSEIDLQNLVRGVVESLLPLAQAKQIDLGCVRLEACSLIGDVFNLMALVRNAVDNAVKYTPVGGRVDVSAYREGSSGIVVIEDSGPGIPVEERAAVFEPFVRLLGSQEIGSGLGLAIARNAATTLGGSITLTDRLDGASGLRFVYVQAMG